LAFFDLVRSRRALFTLLEGALIQLRGDLNDGGTDALGYRQCSDFQAGAPMTVTVDGRADSPLHNRKRRSLVDSKIR
jgi:hypothetical protein